MEISNRKEYMEKYRLKNKDKAKVYNHQWLIANPKYHKQWHKDNPEYNKQYRENNPEKVKKSHNQWRKNNLHLLNEYKKNKCKTDLKFNLNNKISGLIRISLKGNKSGSYWEKFLGYTSKDLAERLKNTIPEGYCWKDYLDGKLQIDHIIPISAFNFDKPEHIDFKRCWSLNNLQLLPARENIIKRNKLTKPFQPTLKI